MASTNTPNMNLILPTVSSEPGPDYAFDINSSLTLIDQHDHSPGSGVQITPAGLNLNASLTFQGNDLTAVGSIIFNAQAIDPTPQSLYVAPGVESPLTQDLWYTDGNGVEIQLTSGGTVNATIASIPGESYAAGTFFWKQGAGSVTPANFDIGSITIRPTVAATTNGVTLNPNPSISTAYNIQLPLLPLATKILGMDTSGNINANVDADNVTLQFSSNALAIKNSGVNTAQIADNAVTTPKIADGSVTAAKLASSVFTWNSQSFSSSSTFVVPADVNEVYIELIGAGGGGGGGTGSGGGTVPAPGGGGGAAPAPNFALVAVTAGETLTVTVGTGGSGGAGAGASGAGVAGSNGGETVILRSTTRLLASPGGLGGTGGRTTGSNGGTGGSNATSGTTTTGAAGALYQQAGKFYAQSAGNGGGATSAGGAGGSGTGFYNYSFTGGAGGASGGPNRGGGGGGGASQYANGGTGASLGAAASGSIGSGGGGGGEAGAGGAGGNGQVIIKWLGHA